MKGKTPAKVRARPKATKVGKSLAPARTARARKPALEASTAKPAKRSKPGARSSGPDGSTASRVKEAIALLERKASKQVRDGMARYAIPSDKAFGVPVGVIRKIAKGFGIDHELSLGLFASEPYEARMLAVFVADSELLTPAQMDLWCAEFDNWAICDTACFHLFDRSRHAFKKVSEWAKRRSEFEKRASFALLASLALHHRSAPDAEFERLLPLIERAADDERNFVKKAVNWALRGVGGRGVALNRAAVSLAEKLARSPDATPRWIGKDALRELKKPELAKRLQTRDAARAARTK
jgi:3-methyladenine DNA glycosylase AlkD